MWSSDTAELFFEDVRVPQKYLLGEEGMGFTYQMLQFQEERIFAAVGGESFAKELGKKGNQKLTLSIFWHYLKIINIFFFFFFENLCAFL